VNIYIYIYIYIYILVQLTNYDIQIIMNDNPLNYNGALWHRLLHQLILYSRRWALIGLCVDPRNVHHDGVWQAHCMYSWSTCDMGSHCDITITSAPDKLNQQLIYEMTTRWGEAVGQELSLHWSRFITSIKVEKNNVYAKTMRFD